VNQRRAELERLTGLAVAGDKIKSETESMKRIGRKKTNDLPKMFP
jgi:hypothetical protein